MNKRTFFKSLASIVATVALAPEIAFGRKLERVVVSPWYPEPTSIREHIVVLRWYAKDGFGGRSEWHSIDADCPPERRQEWNERMSALVESSNPDLFTTVEPMPYSEFQRLRKEAGL